MPPLCYSLQEPKPQGNVMTFIVNLPPALMTSDGLEPIEFNKDSQPAYLIRPRSLSAMPQSRFGVGSTFGGINCFKLLVENNFNDGRLTSEYSEDFGMEIWRAAGYLTETHVFLPELSAVSYSDAKMVEMFEQLTRLPARRYNKEYLRHGKSMATLIAHPDPKPVRLNDLLKAPLKFSFNKDAVYEELTSFSGHIN